MEKDRHLEAYLALCRDIYDRMRREGSWPWPEIDEEIDQTNDTS